MRKRKKHHGGNPAKSERLKRLMAVLADCRWHTKQDIFNRTRSLSITSDIADMKKNGYHTENKYVGTSKRGSRIYAYRWRTK